MVVKQRLGFHHQRRGVDVCFRPHYMNEGDIIFIRNNVLIINTNSGK